MGYINLPNLDDITSIKDPKQQMEALVNTVGLLMKSLSELNGYLQSSNILEVGGWDVSNTELKSKDGDVGMSTEDTSGDDVRFWAGDADKETAPYQVRKSGKASLTGATIQSKSGYPKVLLDPDGNFLGIYTDADNYIQFVPVFTNGKPAFMFVSGDVALGDISVPDALEINGLNGINLTSGTGPIYLSTDSIFGIKFDSWSELKNIATGHSLQQDLNAKADTTALAGKATAGISTSSVGNHNHGIPDGTVLSTPTGTVTWFSSGGHSHTQN